MVKLRREKSLKTSSCFRFSILFVFYHHDQISIVPLFPFEYLYTGLMSSVSAFLSWQGLHNDCRLVLSQNSFWSRRWGMMWSNTVAFVYLDLSKMLSSLFPSNKHYFYFDSFKRSIAISTSSVWYP